MHHPLLQPVSFNDLRGWAAEDHAEAFAAFLVAADHMQQQPYKTRALGVDGDTLARIARRALENPSASSSQARSFFEAFFRPYKIVPPLDQSGFVTGFFEPVVDASPRPTKRFRYPLYSRPPELIDLDDSNRPADMDVSFRFGHEVGGRIVAYHDRPAIQGGVLEGRGLELVWLEDPVDVFFIHVQGAARLKLSDGSFMRVTFSAKSGHPYTSVAKVLCERTGIAPPEMTADRLADWMRSHPEQCDELLSHNKSFIFFRAVEGQDPQDGPIAAAKVPLQPRRSLAVDRTLHTFGVPIWLETLTPLPNEEQVFHRLMIAHDTGSAIVGPARGDIFTGSGAEAGLIAGRIRHQADMTVFIPKEDAGRQG